MVENHVLRLPNADRAQITVLPHISAYRGTVNDPGDDGCGSGSLSGQNIHPQKGVDQGGLTRLEATNKGNYKGGVFSHGLIQLEDRSATLFIVDHLAAGCRDVRDDLSRQSVPISIFVNGHGQFLTFVPWRWIHHSVFCGTFGNIPLDKCFSEKSENGYAQISQAYP